MRLWPLWAISMPHEFGWQRFPCWRCTGTGQLPADDPYVRRVPPPPPKLPMVSVILAWWWAYAVCVLIIIGVLLW